MLNRMVFSTFFAMILFIPLGFADSTEPSSDSLPTVCNEIDSNDSQDPLTQIKALPMETIDCIIGTMELSENREAKANFLDFLDTVIEEPLDVDGNRQTVLQFFNLPEDFKTTFTESEDIQKTLLQSPESVKRAFVEAWMMYNLGAGLAEGLAAGLGAMIDGMAEGMVNALSEGIRESLGPAHSED